MAKTKKAKEIKGWVVERGEKPRAIPLASLAGAFKAALLAASMGGSPEIPIATILESWGIIVDYSANSLGVEVEDAPEGTEAEEEKEPKP